MPTSRQPHRGIWPLVVVVVVALFAAGACRSDASVEMMVDEPQSTAEPDDAQTGTGEAFEPGPETASGARFEVRGELPLSDDEVNGLIEFIERETGRPFQEPPVIVAQTAEAFVEGLEEDLGEFESEADESVRFLQAMGLTTGGVQDVVAAYRALLVSPEGILGYYDPATDELFVPVGATADDDFRSLLVHELTHALDDQYGDLSVLEDLVDEAEVTGNAEPVVGLQAVAEGRAVAVQNAWMRTNGVEQEIPEDLGAAEDVPPAMVLALSIPYAFGEQYILLNGGPAATWELLDDPPISTEVVMIPGPTASEPIVEVDIPDADGAVIDDFVFGASDMLIWLLGDSLEPDTDLVLPVITAIDGWAGGRGVLWGDDSESCVRVALAADSAGDLTEIESVARTWAGDDPGHRRVELDGDLVLFTGCAPYVP